MPCCRRASPTTSWPRPSRPARAERAKSLKDGARSVRFAVQELPDAVGRPGRADVSGEVLRGAGRESTRRSGSTSSSWSTASPGSAQLQRNVGYFYIVALGKRKQYALAADEASRWLATYNRREERRSPEGLGVLIELAKNIDAQMPEIAGRRTSQGDRQDRRRRQPGRALCLAVQEGGAGPPQEIQAERGHAGRGDRSTDLRRRRGEGRGRDRLARVGARDRPLAGGHPQGRPRPRAPTRPTWRATSWRSATT